MISLVSTLLFVKRLIRTLQWNRILIDQTSLGVTPLSLRKACFGHFVSLLPFSRSEPNGPKSFFENKSDAGFYLLPGCQRLKDISPWKLCNLRVTPWTLDYTTTLIQPCTCTLQQYIEQSPCLQHLELESCRVSQPYPGPKWFNLCDRFGIGVSNKLLWLYISSRRTPNEVLGSNPVGCWAFDLCSVSLSWSFRGAQPLISIKSCRLLGQNNGLKGLVPFGSTN